MGTTPDVILDEVKELETGKLVVEEICRLCERIYKVERSGR